MKTSTGDHCSIGIDWCGVAWNLYRSARQEDQRRRC